MREPGSYTLFQAQRSPADSHARGTDGSDRPTPERDHRQHCQARGCTSGRGPTARGDLLLETRTHGWRKAGDVHQEAVQQHILQMADLM